MSVSIGWVGEIPNWIPAAAKAPSNQQLTSLQIKRRKVQSVQKEGCVWGEGGWGWGVPLQTGTWFPLGRRQQTQTPIASETLCRENGVRRLSGLTPAFVMYLVHTALSHTRALTHTHTHTVQHEDATHRTRLLTDTCSHTRAISRRKRVHLANSYQPSKKTLLKNKKQTPNIQPGRKDDPSSAQLFTPLWIISSHLATQTRGWGNHRR